ncbi:TetR family transcriptional regulator [Actinomadura sp. LD22]|uniref:TetR family transcriptional regulator n=1 Tax=Actinomadura physcomitrii TaxID=2650748 RepID=A0A6I4M936_9ACTN|nr:TetR/AcrR family transcriptional regulator [Actinomadura physcomitrii]MWA00925.1 TetR family transcriptional regulator [Actinomadura physcomitrii]
MPPAKERTPELRRHILDTAIDVLASEGVAAVTTRKIAGLAGTSPPAIYELFGHKAGLIRELFFEGFRRLNAAFERLGTSGDAVADLAATVHAFRTFASDNPNLFNVMYNRPFDGFEPDGAKRSVGDGTRRFLVDRVGHCVQAGVMAGDPIDIAHALLGLAIGLATQENAGWLGSTAESRDRRWTLAVDAFIRGFAPAR